MSLIKYKVWYKSYMHINEMVIQPWSWGYSLGDIGIGSVYQRDALTQLIQINFKQFQIKHPQGIQRNDH